MSRPDRSPEPQGQRLRTRIVAAALFVLVGVVLWLAANVVLMVFAGILLGIFLRTLACWVSELTGIPTRWSLLAVLLGFTGAAVLTGWLFAPRLAEESRMLAEKLPEAASNLADRVREFSWGEQVIDEVSTDPSEAARPMMRQATVAAGTVLRVLTGALVVIFIGIYLAANPWPYLRGLLRLLPPQRRRRAGEVLFAIGYTLRWWLVGQVFAMLLVGIAMGLGLWLIGVPLALPLGVLAGLLEFVPTLGPPLAIVPALLLAFVEGLDTVLWVLGLYTAIQTLESYLLTPLLQQRVVSLQPVVTIVAQVLLTWMLGPVGLLVAVPLIATIMVAVQMIYVEDVLDDRLHLAAERAGREEFAASGLRELAEPDR